MRTLMEIVKKCNNTDVLKHIPTGTLINTDGPG